LLTICLLSSKLHHFLRKIPTVQYFFIPQKVGIQGASAYWCTALAARGSWYSAQRPCPGEKLAWLNSRGATGARNSMILNKKKTILGFICLRNSSHRPAIKTWRHPKSPLPTSKFLFVSEAYDPAFGKLQAMSPGRSLGRALAAWL